MAQIEAVQLVGGPCDGQRPQASSYPPSLLQITVVEHADGVAHVYEATDEILTGAARAPRTVFRYARSAGYRSTL
jgi:hypothetical protein